MCTFTESHGLGLKPQILGQLQWPRYLVYLLSRTLVILREYLINLRPSLTHPFKLSTLVYSRESNVLMIASLNN